MFYMLPAVFGGILIVISRIINSNLATKIGVLQGTFFNFISGLLLSFIFFIINKETIPHSNLDFNTVPLWAYFGGFVGLLIVVLSNYMTPKVPVFYLTLFMFVGQLFTGIIIDYFTSNKFSFGKIVGGLLVLIGLIYNLFLDKKEQL